MEMSSSKVIYPYKFLPVTKERVWGGRMLVEKYGKPCESGNPVGESWEISGFEEDSSQISEGYLAGNSLYDVIETYMDEIVGEDNYKRFGNEFPLLMKMLDVEERLSIQVHPDDETAFDRHNSYGKSEAWYILDAKPGAKVYMGFKRDITPAEFLERVENETLEEVLNVYEPHKGDFFYIESGIVHSAGGGVVIAEVQQLSDVTYRIYDWGREHDPATARQMHVEYALDCINYRKYDEERYFTPSGSHSHGALVRNRYFTITPFRLDDPIHIYTDRYESFIVYFASKGDFSIRMRELEGKEEYLLSEGEWIMVPAASPDFYIVPKSGGSEILEFYVEKEEERDSYIDGEDQSLCDDDCHCHDEHCHCHDGSDR